MTKKRVKNEMFELYRVVAVSMVVIGHFSGASKDLPIYMKDFLAAVTHLGVPLFFIISGYLLSESFLSLLKRKKKLLITTKIFFVKRILRIYPAYLVSLGILFYFSNSTWFDFWVHFFNIHNFYEQFRMTINAPYWTLAVEFQWYLIAPLFIYKMSRVITQNKFYIIFVFFIVSFILRYLLLTDFLNGKIGFESLTNFHVQLIAHLFNFMIGIVIQQIKPTKLENIKFLALIVFIALLFGGYWYHNAEKMLHLHPENIHQNQLIFFYINIFLLGFLVYLGSNKKRNRNNIISFFSSISYSWYIYHMPILIYLESFEFLWYELLPLFLIISIVISSFSYYFIEKPFLQLSFSVDKNIR